MANLLDKLKSERRITVNVGDATFYGTRATLEQSLSYGGYRNTDADVCRKHIDGWDGVKESDIVPGGADRKIPFNKELFDFIIGDKIEWWPEIAKEIMKDSAERMNTRSDNKKK